MSMGTRSYALLRLGIGGSNILKSSHNRWTYPFVNNSSSKKLQNLISLQQRTYLSESFQCNEAWQERLNVSPIASLELNKYYFNSREHVLYRIIQLVR